jgi:hypothetical protein
MNVPLLYRGCRCRELAQIGVASSPIKKSEKAGPTENPPSPALYTAWDCKMDWNSDWHPAGLQTTARRDFSCSWVVCISSKTKQKGGGPAVRHHGRIF